MQYGATMLTALVLFAGVATAQEKRELGPHEHGHGTLNIALEGNQLAIEIDVPGMDVLGFEYLPVTPAEKDAAAKTEKLLADPLALFVLPSGAGCLLVEAKVEREQEEGHANYAGDYRLSCTTPAALRRIDFDYFRIFPGAQALTVNLLLDSGQTMNEVTRANPRLELTAPR